jgi:hypothetical protein
MTNRIQRAHNWFDNSTHTAGPGLFQRKKYVTPSLGCIVTLSPFGVPPSGGTIHMLTLKGRRSLHVRLGARHLCRFNSQPFGDFLMVRKPSQRPC